MNSKPCPLLTLRSVVSARDKGGLHRRDGRCICTLNCACKACRTESWSWTTATRSALERSLPIRLVDKQGRNPNGAPVCNRLGAVGLSKPVTNRRSTWVAALFVNQPDRQGTILSGVKNKDRKTETMSEHRPLASLAPGFVATHWFTGHSGVTHLPGGGGTSKGRFRGPGEWIKTPVLHVILLAGSPT